jgi:predicted nucleic acid-binding protein
VNHAVGVDAGPLYAYIDADDADHQPCATVVACAERLGISEIATLDHPHFHAIRPGHVKNFTLLPS